MRALSKPISSPGRAEKFPPPLMRFLRSNAGSRNRGRSRSSPIFYLRSKRRLPGGVIETTQEPSSPKVTCIGQVRVRRKKNGASAADRRRRHWLSGALSCRNFSCGFTRKPLGRFFRRCGSMFRFTCCGEDNNFRVYSDRECGENENCTVGGDDTYNNSDQNNTEDNRNMNSIRSNAGETHFCRNKSHDEIERDGSKDFKRDLLESSSSSSPPANALILTRCRSAPYRSSSLAGRFWAEEKGGKTGELEKPRCVEKSVVDENSQGFGKNVEGLNKVDNFKGFSGHPLLLTRCKSEPARRGERLGFVDTVEKG